MKNKIITSGYIYRNFNNATSYLFETLDIINCSFGVSDEFGYIKEDEFFENVSKYIIPKAKENNVKVILSIAPSSKWGKFSRNYLNQFCTNVINLVNKYDFDGVDIDWEHPLIDEIEDFTNLSKALYEKLKTNNPNHLLTTAITGGMWQITFYNIQNTIKYFDYINVMTYSLSSNSGFHQSALYKSVNYDNKEALVGHTNTSCSFEETLDIFTQSIPKEKLIFGIPFYGARQIRSKTEENTYTNWKSPGCILYSKIKSDYLNNQEFTYYFDDTCKVPYLLKNDLLEFISYDNPLSIKYKLEYLIKEKVGGVMFWEYGCLDNDDLIEVIKKTST